MSILTSRLAIRIALRSSRTRVQPRGGFQENDPEGVAFEYEVMD